MSKFIATQDFKNEGTGKAFFAGKPVEDDEGQIANYKAAGLVIDDADKSAAKTADAKGGEVVKTPNP